MARLIRFALLLAVVVTTANACATTYYIAADGSDSNSGTSMTAPWLHAPGMTGCTANCGAKTPQPGDRFILRGGDTWHFTNMGTPVGLPWTWSWSGTSGSRIYIGVDNTWYTGSSWARPKMTGDNSLSTSPVASCSNTNSGFFTQNGNFADFDNVEFLGMCFSGADGHGASSCGSGCDDGQLTMNAGTHDSTFQNLYIHGWTHKTFSCSYTTQLNGNCDVGMAIINDSHSNGDVNNQYIGIVVDGADSDPLSFGCIAYGGYDIHYSVCRYNSQAFVTNNTRYFHDNLIEYINESSDGVRHSNTWEMNGSNAPLDWYNNTVRHIGLIKGIGVNLWFNPGGDLHYYNNLLYDINAGGNYWDVAGTGGTYYLYNNTFGSNTPNSNPVIGNNTFQPPIRAINNHFVGLTSSPFMSSTGVISTTPLYQDLTTATSQGYTSSETYPYSPPNSSGSTVGTGTNLTSLCGTNFVALCSDTTLGVYDAVNHAVIYPARTPVARPSSAAWDIGAFQFGGASASVNPPVGLTAVVQ